MENGEITCVIFGDISKAFDRLWHRGLLEKLKSYGICGNLLLWIKNYITGRKQKVVIKNSESTIGVLNAGVPQGSVLGPLLFLLFINDIADDIQSFVRLFADDSSLMYSSLDPLEVERRLNLDLVVLNDWAKRWLVNFNPQKTEYMMFTFRRDIMPMNLVFDDQDIQLVENHKHLGITFSADCRWSVHIDNICNSASKQIFVLRKLKYILSRYNLNKIYQTYILPLLEYACEVWDGCCLRDSDKLERLQLEAARIITGLPQFSSKESLYFETGWETLECRRHRRKLSLLYKIHNQKAPSYLVDCLDEYAYMGNYNLRNVPQYRVPRCRLETFSRSFFPSCIRSWNSLSPECRSCSSVLGFKKSIRGDKHMIPSYYYIGSRKLNIIHTRLRHRCSILKADLFRVNLVNDSSCSCGCPLEDAIHYFLECPLYIGQRAYLLNAVQQYVVVDIETLLFGSDQLSEELNKSLFLHVQRYIQHSKRFTD